MMCGKLIYIGGSSQQYTWAEVIPSMLLTNTTIICLDTEGANLAMKATSIV